MGRTNCHTANQGNSRGEEGRMTVLELSSQREMNKAQLFPPSTLLQTHPQGFVRTSTPEGERWASGEDEKNQF